MINIYFFYTKTKTLKGFEIKGHSHFFKKLGYKIKRFIFNNNFVHSKDYICSAVSAVSYMAVIGLADICKKNISYKVNNTGFMECYLKDRPDKQSNIILKMLLETLRKIDEKYPGHLMINLEEE